MAITDPIFDNPQFNANPYLIYDQLRRDDPVHWSDAREVWILTRYSDVKAALRDDRLSARKTEELLRPEDQEPAKEEGPFDRHLSLFMSLQDPPLHTRYRKIAHRGFTACIAEEEIRPKIRRIAESLLEKATQTKPFDLIASFAERLPATVIAELFGVQATHHPMFLHCTKELALLFGGAQVDAETRERAHRSVAQMREYLYEAIRHRRRNPGKDLISRFAASQGSEMLTDEELCAQSVNIIAAGHVTTVDLIGNGCYALLQNSDQMHKLLDNLDNEASLEAAIEEMLRYDSPVQLVHRVATEGSQYYRKTTKRERPLVYAMLGAANRDPEKFTEPNRFDIARTKNEHLSFGAGIHFCLGEQLARWETQIAIRSLLQKLPELRLAQEAVKWKENGPLYRGLSSLSVTW